jgi:hypothetical protein
MLLLWLLGTLLTYASSSGIFAVHVCCPVGSSSQLLDLNPDGWSRGCTWHMFYGADVNRELRLVLAGAAIC